MARPKQMTTAEIVEALADEVRTIERSQSWQGQTISSGSAAVDALLPEKGLRRGALVEWLSAGPGSGAVSLALLAAREGARQGGAVVVVDRERTFYPPAAVQLGIELEKLLVVRPASERDTTWAVDQILRCRGVAAALCWPGRWHDHTFRRLQLAAEESGVLGLFVRDAAVRNKPSWAQLRLLVEPLSSQVRPGGVAWRRLRVELLRCRGGAGSGTVELDLDELLGVDEKGLRYEQGTLSVVSQLAAIAPARRSSGA